MLLFSYFIFFVFFNHFNKEIQAKIDYTVLSYNQKIEAINKLIKQIEKMDHSNKIELNIAKSFRKMSVNTLTKYDFSLANIENNMNDLPEGSNNPENYYTKFKKIKKNFLNSYLLNENELDQILSLLNEILVRYQNNLLHLKEYKNFFYIHFLEEEKIKIKKLIEIKFVLFEETYKISDFEKEVNKNGLESEDYKKFNELLISNKAGMYNIHSLYDLTKSDSFYNNYIEIKKRYDKITLDLNDCLSKANNVKKLLKIFYSIQLKKIYEEEEQEEVFNQKKSLTEDDIQEEIKNNEQVIKIIKEQSQMQKFNIFSFIFNLIMNIFILFFVFRKIKK
ncbi:hypothetical protein LFWB_0860 [Candidatus Phytoplasma luffae]|uniref:Uncharacterized protein n=1 Tax=Loofah witches'-broom phytoplasma TaxID=35773 RepID=A0A975FKK4_LOWBP|nr:hypothetical protein LFWB_0860 [Candidatus Phytoplasma luffae]